MELINGCLSSAHPSFIFIEDIRLSMKWDWCCCVQHVLQEVNSAADYLAMLGSSSADKETRWFFPPGLSSLLSADSAGATFWLVSLFPLHRKRKNSFVGKDQTTKIF